MIGTTPARPNDFQANAEERARIGDAICARSGEMMTMVHRCVPRLPLRYADHPTALRQAATGPEERRKIVTCVRGHIVDLATNSYGGPHVLQKVLGCEEEEVYLLILSELLRGDRATTLVNTHASHLGSQVRAVFILSNLYHSSSALPPSFSASIITLCFHLYFYSSDYLYIIEVLWITILKL
ncbi:hypothetical protein B0H14DRAFT_3516503 [Mycena olivaceomarginata]|nr:hypothetical protein B0H14DRAFT_3516503 [Mycena olivaceomarginata]